MTDHRRKLSHAVRLAKEIHGRKLLMDQFPTHYLPHVGRQVMQSGGVPEEPALYDEMGNVVVPFLQKSGKNGPTNHSHGFIRNFTIDELADILQR